MLTRVRPRGRLCWAGLALLSVLLGLWLTGGRAIDFGFLSVFGVKSPVLGMEVSQGAVVLSAKPPPAPLPTPFPAPNARVPAWVVRRPTVNGYHPPIPVGAGLLPEYRPDPFETRLSLPFWLLSVPLFTAAFAAFRLPRAGPRWWVRRRLQQAALFAAFLSVLGALPRRWDNGFAIDLGARWIPGIIAKNGYLAAVVMIRQSWDALSPWDPSKFSDRLADSKLEIVTGSPGELNYARGTRGAVGFIGDLHANEQCWTAGLDTWFLLPAVAIPTLAAAWRSRMTRRADGSCPRCHYDLSGQQAPGCPECGHGRPAKTNTGPPSGARA